LQKLDIQYEKVGCFPKVASDTEPISDERDMKCKNYAMQKACRSGLPFFRLKVQEDGAAGTCFRYCTSKGLDLFGLIRSDGMECRCGASEGNAAVWHHIKNTDVSGSPLQLDLSTALSTSQTEPCSAIEVYRYIGWMEMPEAGGVPWALQEPSVLDTLYIDSIVHGSPHPVLSPSVITAPKTWPQKLRVSGIRVPYVLASADLDDNAHDVFCRATADWSYQTSGCVRFYPATGVVAKQAHLSITFENPDMCGPEKSEYPGAGKALRLDLGGCATPRNMGQMVQALGAALGVDVPLEGLEGGLGQKGIRKALTAYPCTGEHDAALSLLQRPYNHTLVMTTMLPQKHLSPIERRQNS